MILPAPGGFLDCLAVVRSARNVAKSMLYNKSSHLHSKSTAGTQEPRLQHAIWQVLKF